MPSRTAELSFPKRELDGTEKGLEGDQLFTTAEKGYSSRSGSAAIFSSWTFILQYVWPCYPT